jgi:hypothetical protein
MSFVSLNQAASPDMVRQAHHKRAGSQSQATEGDPDACCGGALMAWLWREDIKRDFGGGIDVVCIGR